MELRRDQLVVAALLLCGEGFFILKEDTVMAAKTNNKRVKKLYGPPAKVLRFLESDCQGKANAKYAADICGPCYITDSQLREIVNELRRRGYPVCSNSSYGYWYATAESDIDTTIKHMVSRRTGINNALRGLRSAKKKIARTVTKMPAPVN